jgi:Kelch motif
MKNKLNPNIQAHLLPSAFILLSLLAICVIPFALGRPMQPYSSKIFSRAERPGGIPCTPGWSAGGNFPSVGVRSVGVYFPANGKFYAMGGRSSELAGSDFTHPFEYDPAANTWTTKSAMYTDPQVNNMACGVLTLGGVPYIYCVGGSAATQTTATARVFYYNPVTDSLTYLPSGDDWPGDAVGTILPGGFAVYNNKLYILGGYNFNVASTNQIWQFDPTQAVGAKWTQMVNCPMGVMYAPTCTIGDIIYLAGATDYSGGNLIDTTNSFSFNPTTNTIGSIAPIPRATGETRALTFNGKMLVMGGGRVPPQPSNEVDAYDPVTNTWTVNSPVSAFVTPRRNFATDTNGTDHIWLAAGYAPGPPATNSTEVFCQGEGTPTPTPTASPTPTATPSASPSCTPTYVTATGAANITTGGTDTGNHCDDCEVTVNLPFSVNVYGTPTMVAYAGSNGTLQFAGPNPKPVFFAQCVPVFTNSGGPFLNTLFPYYDDLRTDELGTCPDCGVFTQTVGSAPNRQFIFRWKTTYFNHTGTAEFEVLLTEGSDVLSVIYGPSDNNGLDAGTGIQKDVTVFTSFSCSKAVLTPGVRVDYIPTGCGSPTPTPTATPTSTSRPSPTARPRPTPAPRP